MNIEYKFDIGDLVSIQELDLKGRVIALWSGKRGNEILVRYFWNAKVEEIYFFEEELKKVNQ